jgi:hypothetical protein
MTARRNDNHSKDGSKSRDDSSSGNKRNFMYVLQHTTTAVSPETIGESATVEKLATE